MQAVQGFIRLKDFFSNGCRGLSKKCTEHYKLEVIVTTETVHDFFSDSDDLDTVITGKQSVTVRSLKRQGLPLNSG